jgi:hypothetical protein
VFAFYDTVCARVVPQYLYVVQVVLRGEVFDSLDNWRTVVRDYFDQRTPSIYDVLPNPLSDCLVGFAVEHTLFRVVDDHTSADDDLCESSQGREVHCVDVYS